MCSPKSNSFPLLKRLVCLLLVLSLASPASFLGIPTPLPSSASAADYVYEYFDRYVGSSRSLVEALQAINAPSSFGSRYNIAALNGISNYRGTSQQNTLLLNKLKAGVLIKSKSAPSSSWQINMPSSVTISQGQTYTVDVLFCGSGINSYSGTYTSPSTLSAYFDNAVWNPAGQWCSVQLVLEGKNPGKSTVTFKLNGSRSLTKSMTVTVLGSSSLVETNLSKVTWSKQWSQSCKATSLSFALNTLLGYNKFTTSSCGGNSCSSINGKTYLGSDGHYYKATYKFDGDKVSSSEQSREIQQALNSGLPIVIAVHSTRAGRTKHHWVLCVGRSGSDLLVVDPASGRSGSLADNVKTLSSLNYALGLTDYSTTHYGYISFKRS